MTEYKKKVKVKGVFPQDEVVPLKGKITPIMKQKKAKVIKF